MRLGKNARRPLATRLLPADKNQGLLSVSSSAAAVASVSVAGRGWDLVGAVWSIARGGGAGRCKQARAGLVKCSPTFPSFLQGKSTLITTPYLHLHAFLFPFILEEKVALSKRVRNYSRLLQANCVHRWLQETGIGLLAPNLTYFNQPLRWHSSTAISAQTAGTHDLIRYPTVRLTRVRGSETLPIHPSIHPSILQGGAGRLRPCSQGIRRRCPESQV
ncbi:hypothetical protein B0T26DRAFT_469548 [Lasiosphaeria miniovina]|uniref:Uncharacterized protein n=1 Tax=Lasiosphaeria miniovina TaxID=1954250 RepID=A0AA39ZZX6_9PEZI|nr:uncharacterized protein B0T26DRAFT_469548 [Lasiosphaeria miniovina]KAK0706723.1 hypothetical protein B0T26DRAFT_469548 [Lasiosphaeria miniovina]